MKHKRTKANRAPGTKAAASCGDQAPRGRCGMGGSRTSHVRAARSMSVGWAVVAEQQKQSSRSAGFVREICCYSSPGGNSPKFLDLSLDRLRCRPCLGCMVAPPPAAFEADHLLFAEVRICGCCLLSSGSFIPPGPAVLQRQFWRSSSSQEIGAHALIGVHMAGK